MDSTKDNTSVWMRNSSIVHACLYIYIYIYIHTYIHTYEQYKRQHKRMDEKFIWKVMRQILLALHTCHHRDEVILHRDLKPANILLDQEYEVKGTRCRNEFVCVCVCCRYECMCVCVL